VVRHAPAYGIAAGEEEEGIAKTDVDGALGAEIHLERKVMWVTSSR
jgi:hypothetical protein